MSAKRSSVFPLLIFLLLVGFVFNVLPSKEDVARYYDALVSFEWLPSTAYVEGQYEGILGTAGNWVEEGRSGFTALLNSEYGEYVRRFLLCYPVFALAILVFPWYPKTFNQFFGHLDKGDVVLFLFFCFLCVLGALLFSAWLAYLHIVEDTRNWPLQNDRITNSVLALLLFVPGLAGLLVAIAFVVSGVIWVPLVLYFLPGFVCALVLATTGKGIFLFLSAPVTLVLIAWHYLHYLFVPHPAETAYRTGIARRLPTTELAASVAQAMCKDDIRRRFGRKRYPRAWVSKNEEKRINALADKVKANSDFLIELKRNLRLRDEFGN